MLISLVSAQVHLLRTTCHDMIFGLLQFPDFCFLFGLLPLCVGCPDLIGKHLRTILHSMTLEIRNFVSARSCLDITISPSFKTQLNEELDTQQPTLHRCRQSHFLLVFS